MHFQTDAGLWGALLLAVGLAVAAYLLYRREVKGRRPWVRRWLPLLRAAVVFLALFILAQPVLRHRMQVGELARVRIFVDASQSMSVPDLDMPPARKLVIAQKLGWLAPGTVDLETVAAANTLHWAAADAAAAVGHSEQAGQATQTFADSLDTVERHLRGSILWEPWSGTGGALARFHAELLDPARALADKKGVEPRVRLEGLTPLLDVTARWEKKVRDDFDAACLSLISTGGVRIQDVLTRFDGMTRWERLQLRLLGTEHPLLADLAKRHDVELIAMQEDKFNLLWESRAGRLDQTARIPQTLQGKPEGRFSDLATPLADTVSAANKNQAAPAAGQPGKNKVEESARRTAVILFSDGRHNSGESPQLAAKILGNRGVPVFTIGIGAAEEMHDLAVLGVEAPDSAFFKDRVRGQVTLSDTMTPGQAFDVRVECDGKSVWEKQLQTQGSGRRLVEFDFPLEKLVEEKRRVADQGLRFSSLPLLFTAKVGALKTDRELRNNEMPFGVRAILQKRRVLLIEGRPRWEWRYVRNILERDEQWETNSILVDATADKPQLPRAQAGAVPNTAPAAGSPDAAAGDFVQGQFPADRDGLYAYDTLILGEVPPETFKPEELEWIRDFVADRGGGLILVDGRHDQLRKFANTVAGSVMPVKFLPSAAPAPVAGAQAFRLTPAGKTFAALQLTSDSARNAALWTGFPTPQWIASVEALPGTETLLELACGDQRVQPLLVLRRLGTGKVLYAGFDESWRLRYKVGDSYQPKYWHQLCRWIGEPPFAVRDRRISLDTGPLSFKPGSQVEIRARLRDAAGKPLRNADAMLVLRCDGRTTEQVPLVADASNNGLYRGTTAALVSGAYVVTVKGAGLGDSSDKVSTSFMVAPPEIAELSQLGCNEPLLRQLAADGRGGYLREEDAEQLAGWLTPLNTGRIIENETILWQSYWWLMSIVLLLLAEWLLRRKAGLP